MATWALPLPVSQAKSRTEVVANQRSWWIEHGSTLSVVGSVALGSALYFTGSMYSDALARGLGLPNDPEEKSLHAVMAAGAEAMFYADALLYVVIAIGYLGLAQFLYRLWGGKPRELPDPHEMRSWQGILFLAPSLRRIARIALPISVAWLMFYVAEYTGRREAERLRTEVHTCEPCLSYVMGERTVVGEAVFRSKDGLYVLTP